MKLYELTEQYNGLMDISDDLPEDALKDTLEALTGQFDDKALSVAAVIKNLGAEVDQISNEIRRLTDMKKARGNRVSGLKEYLLFNMQSLDKSKIKNAMFSISKQKGRMSVVVDDVDNLPMEFRKISVSADRTALKKWLDGGHELDSAKLERGDDILMIR